jgi:AraC-like DNA-binding protein
MEEARRLLGERKLTIAAVALQCGYEDAFHFSRVFRRFHGRSPRLWLTQAMSSP